MKKKDNYLVSVIIPAYNEEKTLEEIIDKVSRVDINKEIIVIDDGSSDNTGKILSNIKDKYSLKVITLERNFGKGYAIRKGIELSNGDIIIMQDVDDHQLDHLYNNAFA